MKVSLTHRYPPVRNGRRAYTHIHVRMSVEQLLLALHCDYKCHAWVPKDEGGREEWDSGERESCRILGSRECYKRMLRRRRERKERRVKKDCVCHLIIKNSVKLLIWKGTAEGEIKQDEREKGQIYLISCKGYTLK